MDITAHLESRDSFLERIDQANTLIKMLSKTLMETLRPTQGPHLLFSKIANASQRCDEIKLVVDRLYETRVLLLKSDLLGDLALENGETDAPSNSAKVLFLENNMLNKQIVLDFQTMLIFTGILLDDWAIIAGHVLGVPRPTKSTFDRIAKDDGNGVYAILWEKHKEAILWLDAIPRIYRNKMIVHQERPWQIGNSRSLSFLDWSFWTPIAVGWYTDEEIDAKHNELSEVAKAIGLKPESRIQSLVLQLLKMGSELTQEQRKLVYKVAEEFGFQTPSFQEFAHRLVDFILAATATLDEVIRNEPSSVNLGKRN